MWQCNYAKEPFDLKLFILQSIKRLKWIVLSALIGALCIGGIYYLKNVTFGGRIPYVVNRKYDVEYAINPKTNTEYSYYVAYTWNDWVKSDAFLESVLGKMPMETTKEELIGYYEMTLPADIRNPYLVVTHAEQDKAARISEILSEELILFFEDQIEIESMTVIDTEGPIPEVRDIRTFRAVVLGAVIGTFFALFAIAFRLILDEGIFVPEIFTYRYHIPVPGYIDVEGQASEGVKEGLKYLFKEKGRIGITAVEPEVDLTMVQSLFEEDTTVCIPSVQQVPEAVEYLRKNDGNLLLVKAGCGNGKAIESVLYQYRMHDIEITAAVLVDADRKLIERYRFGMQGKKEDA